MSNKPVLVVAAVFFRINPEGIWQVLMFRRASPHSGAGSWEFPGGKVEPGENDFQALEREIMEELSIPIKILSFAGENLHTYPNKTILLKAYFVEKNGNQDIVLIDHDDFGWFDQKTIQNLKIAPADLPLIETVFTQLKN
jgi:mutator protein MutT